MGDYYINWGRWADSICGPFDTHDAAAEYASRTQANNAKIVTLAPPLNTWIIEWEQGNLMVTTKVKAKGILAAKKIVAQSTGLPEWRFNYAGVEA